MSAAFGIAAHIAPWTTEMINRMVEDNNTLLSTHPGDAHAEFRARITVTRDAALAELHGRAEAEYQAHLAMTPAERHMVAQRAVPAFTSVPALRTNVYYLGSLREAHGVYVVADICECDDCEKLAELYRHAGGAMHVSDVRLVLRSKDRNSLHHVRVGSVRRELQTA